MGFEGLIVGVTGDMTSENVQKFLESGADSVCSKPFTHDNLIDQIEGKQSSCTINPHFCRIWTTAQEHLINEWLC